MKKKHLKHHLQTYCVPKQLV